MLPAQLHEYTGADINVYFNIAADYLLCGEHSDAGRTPDSGNMSHETYHGGVQGSSISNRSGLCCMHVCPSLAIVCKSYSGEKNINNQPEMYFVENIFFHQTRK